VRPFLRWAGGKSWLAERIKGVAPLGLKTYYEPFLGSGAVFFALAPSRAVLSDLNPELVNAFRMVQREPEDLIARLEGFTGGEKEYKEVRASSPRAQIERAARFLYLNRTCWNGLYRVNADGGFNVPYGWGDRPLFFDRTTIRQASKALARTSIRRLSFIAALKDVRQGDMVFADPPYARFRHRRGFLSYNNRLFDWEEQEKLAEALERVAEVGAHFLLTEPDIPSIRRLYSSNGMICTAVSHSSIIAADPSRRGRSRELLISNYDLRGHPPPAQRSGQPA
jgi:DNA adenine methylase